MIITVYLKSGHKLKVNTTGNFIENVERYMTDDRTRLLQLFTNVESEKSTILIPIKNIDYFEVIK